MGLLEWWTNVINRTDLKKRKENASLKSPNMLGNIQVLFVILGVGLAVAILSVIVELKGVIGKHVKILGVVFW